MDRNRLNRHNTRSGRSPSPKKVADIDSENSPLQIACTQESSDNIDVVWDWNSPQAKKHPRKYQKRLLAQSPKVPLKRNPSSNCIQDFEKLRVELKALREELAVPDHEESLQLSPVEEAEYKGFDHDTTVHQLPEDEFDELMDENVNEQLFAFSQQIEEDLKTMQYKDSPLNSPNKKSSPNLKFRKISPRQKGIADDFFEDLLKTVNIDKLTNSQERISTSSESNLNACNHVESVVRNVVKTNSGKFEFHRTQSFELSNINDEKKLNTFTQDEIERKRLEALAKLEAKKKLNRHLATTQFSEEEIEQKRSQALAKIEAKRQQDIIERKRQEALKRLQMKRQKNATAVKGILAPRLK